MDYKLLFDVAVLAGELMAANGAETYRVEDTMIRILQLSKLKTTEVFVTMTGFSVTLDDPKMDSMTVVRRISKREVNLSKVHEVNKLSRELCQEEISLEEALQKLKKMKHEIPPLKGNLLSMTAITAGFTLMFGGKVLEVLLAGVAGLCSALVLKFCKGIKMNTFLCNVLCATTIAIVAYMGKMALSPTYDLDVIIIGSIMPFVPGVAITNAVFDTLHGDYLSGVARALEALVIAVAVAVGIAMGMSLCRFLTGGM